MSNEDEGGGDYGPIVLLLASTFVGVSAVAVTLAMVFMYGL